MKLFAVLSSALVAFYALATAFMWLLSRDVLEALGDAASVTAVLIAGGVGLVLYFAPTFVAAHRQHTSANGIVILNLLLGWTFLGWIIALVWAASGQHATSAS